MTRLLEDLSLQVVAEHGVPTPRTAVTTSAAEAAELAARWEAAVVLKALVPVGGRQKGGVIRFAATAAEAELAAAALLGRDFKRFPVDRLLISEQLAIRREFFLSITFDSASRSPVVLFSAEGGVDIEQVARTRPDAVVSRILDITLGLREFEAREIALAAGLRSNTLLAVAGAMRAAYAAFRASDARLVEINPLAELEDGRVVAASAVVTTDDQARFRQEALYARNQQAPNNGWRPFTPLELEMRAIDEADPNIGNIRFNEFEDGDIALMITGGGGGLTTLDAMIRASGRPATTFDIKIGQIEEKVYQATRAVLARPGLRGLVVGANFSNFTGIDIKARGVVRAVRDSGVDARAFPIVMRFCGPNQDVAAQLAATVPGLEYLDDTCTLEDAVERVVQRAYAAAKQREVVPA